MNCLYCGNYHNGMCWRVKSIEYHENGAVRKVELHDSSNSPPMVEVSIGTPVIRYPPHRIETSCSPY